MLRRTPGVRALYWSLRRSGWVRFTGFRRGFVKNGFPRKRDFPVFYPYHFYGDFIADFNDIFDVGNPVGSQFADVYHAVFAGQEFNDSPERKCTGYFSCVNRTNLDVFSQSFDNFNRVLR
jgi:hypothetical protein